MHKYTELRVYGQALAFTEAIYKYTSNLPPNEKYGLTSQLRRAAVSIPSNLAEGCGRSTNRDTARFVSISIGSLYEVDTQLRLANRFGYGQIDYLEKDILSISKQLISFRKYLLSKQ